MSDRTATILIADDNKFMREDLALTLKDRPFRLLFADSAKATLAQARAERPDLVLLDLVFPDCDDLSLLRELKNLPEGPDIIMISGNTDDLGLVVNAIKQGAFDFVSKPYNDAELLNRVDHALKLKTMRRAQASLLHELRGAYGPGRLLGESTLMRQVRDALQRLADHEGCVLIGGESGTGKELAARTLHFAGRRADRPFVVINCAAIPDSLTESVLFGHRKGAFTGAHESAKGQFELAEDGTIFMDEIGDMPLRQQAALLRVLEYRTFAPIGDTRERACRARFVFATNRDLKASVKSGDFREDLYHRINVAHIQLPSLVARTEDLQELAEYYAARLCAEMGRPPVILTDEALAQLKRYDWPGNVRELRNVLEASIMLLNKDATELTPELFPRDLATETGNCETSLTPRQLSEKDLIEQSLKEHGGNQTAAAKALGCHRNTIRAKVRYYGITL